jgi:hypothetical protein
VVTASLDNTARLWDADTGTEAAVLKGHTNWVQSAAFSPDGKRVVTASDDNTARLRKAVLPHVLDDAVGPRHAGNPVSIRLVGLADRAEHPALAGAGLARDDRKPSRPRGLGLLVVETVGGTRPLDMPGLHAVPRIARFGRPL